MGLIETTDRDGVRIVALRDEAGQNALDRPMVEALTDALAVPESVRAVVLRGAPEVFSRGASPRVLAQLEEGEIAPTELTLPRAVLGVEVPVVAAMEGHAIGGGLALGLCADVVVLAEESRYGATFVDLGFTPGMGMTRLLERVMSPLMAHELLLGGEPRRGRDLRHVGFNHVVPRREVWPRALEIADRFAEKRRSVLTMLKAELARPWRRAFEEAREAEAEMHARCFEGLRRASDA